MPKLRYLCIFATCLAWLVLMLGAYTRLTHAGLGCPDWPLCYGKALISQANSQLAPIDVTKAMTEMAHRYAAGTLALLIFVIGIIRLIKVPQLWLLPTLLMALVIFQAALGMWTVTLKLLPIVVMGHLLGGMIIFSLLCCLTAQVYGCRAEITGIHTRWIGLGLLLVFCQIALGGWVSANYAGIACLGFPKCNGLWWPELNFTEGFHLLSPVGINYQGGVLESAVRVSIQFVHRLVAFMVLFYLVMLSAVLMYRASEKMIRLLAWLCLGLVFLQVCLGIINVVYVLPLPVAVAHNGVAALLLAALSLLFYVSKKEAKANANNA